MRESDYLAGHDELLPEMLKLASLSCFKEDHLRRILKLSKVRAYEPGETIISQGHFDSWVFILIHGAVRVEKDGKAIGTLKRAGDLFGEMSVITGESRSASVTATSPTTCLAIDGSIMENRFDNDHSLFIALLYKLFSEILSSRLDTANRELSKAREDVRHLEKQLKLLHGSVL